MAIHRQQSYEIHIYTDSMNDKAVLFDADSADRWIQSDAVVDLADNV